MTEKEFLNGVVSENFEKRACNECGATFAAFKWEKDSLCPSCSNKKMKKE
jgi:rubrerythrin